MHLGCSITDYAEYIYGVLLRCTVLHIYEHGPTSYISMAVSCSVLAYHVLP